MIRKLKQLSIATMKSYNSTKAVKIKVTKPSVNTAVKGYLSTLVATSTISILYLTNYSGTIGQSKDSVTSRVIRKT